MNQFLRLAAFCTISLMNVCVLIHLSDSISVHSVHFIHYIFPSFLPSPSSIALMLNRYSLHVITSPLHFSPFASYPFLRHIFKFPFENIFLMHLRCQHLFLTAIFLYPELVFVNQSFFLSLSVKSELSVWRKIRLCEYTKVCLHLIFLVLCVSERTKNFQGISHDFY